MEFSISVETTGLRKEKLEKMGDLSWTQTRKFRLCMSIVLPLLLLIGGSCPPCFRFQ